MTERGGGPPAVASQSAVQSNKSSGGGGVVALQINQQPSSASPSKHRILVAASDYHHQHHQQDPYHEQLNDRKQSQMEHPNLRTVPQHNTLQQFAGHNINSQSSSSQHNAHGGSTSTNNTSAIPPTYQNNQQLQVGSDLKLMNLTQAQINVSKMIQSRDSEAARKALEMSKQVQSNTMSVRDQIARIQQQVQMQKQKASKAAAEEQLYQPNMMQANSVQQYIPQQQHLHHQHHQQQQQQQQQHQQMLQRNPLSGTIQMNMQNSMSKPVQPQPYASSNATSTVASNHIQVSALQSPLIGGVHSKKAQQQFVASQPAQSPPQFQQYKGPTHHQPHHVQQYSNHQYGSESNSLHHQQQQQRKATNQSDLLKAKSTGDGHHINNGANNSNGNVIRIAKKPSSQSGYHQMQSQQNQQQLKQPIPVVSDHQTSPGVVLSGGNNSKLIKLKAPQIQTLNQQKQQYNTAVSVTNTNNQEQGQLNVSKKQQSQHVNEGTNRVRPYPSQLSQNAQANAHQSVVSGKPVGMGGRSGDRKISHRRKSSSGLKDLREQRIVEDIMPAQQSNISAEDLDDDEGRIKEIPRQSVLSNLVESSISNFENEESVEDGGLESEKGGGPGGFSDVKSCSKNIIRIEKQGSIDTSKQHFNLKSRKSQKQDAANKRNMMLVANKNNRPRRRVDEPIVVNSVHDVGGQQHREEKNSSIHQRKDIDSDNKSLSSDQGANGKGENTGNEAVKSGMRKRKQNSIMALRRKKHGQQQSTDKQNQPRNINNPSQVTVGGSANPTVIALNGAITNSQDPIEIRGVETIEEFFRPEFAQNTQSLDDINDDSDDRSDDDNASDAGEAVKMMSALDGNKNRGSKLKRQSASSKQAPFPQFSDNDNSASSSGSGNSQVDIGKDHNKAQFRNMGFPNMNYLDPEANGPPLQTQTYYKNFEEDQDNDIKVKREEMSNAREQMPNNTFIKLFHFLNADAGEGGVANAGDTEDDRNEKDAFRDGMGFDRLEGYQGGGGLRANKQDELQSIQYVDVNYVESSMETDNEAAMANFNREIASPAGDVRIIYNPAKNKSKSLGRVGLADQLNQFHSMNQDSDKAANPNSQLRQRKGSMLGGMRDGVSDKNQSHGRRQRIKANSSEKLPPLLSNKNITAENGSGSRKRLIQPPEIGGHQQPHSEKGGNQSRQKTRAAHHDSNNQDSQANIFLKQALGNDLVPINFEMKGRTNKQLGEVSAKARLNGNLTTINGQNEGHQHAMHQRHMQEQHLKSSSNPSLRPNQGRSGSINVDLVAKHSISTSNQGVVGAKHPKMSFMTSDHNMYHHHTGVGGGGFLSPQQATPAINDQDSNLPPILKNQENYFSRNGVINQVNSGQNDRQGGAVGSGEASVGQPLVAANQKHFGMMHKRIENQHQRHGVFSGSGPGVGPHQGQVVSNFMQSSPNAALQLQQQQSPTSQALTTSNSPTNRNNTNNAADQQFFSNSSDRRAPIKAFPTPTAAMQHGSNPDPMEEQQQVAQPAGEEDMQEFVNDFERATMSEKAHDQMLSLKKIRLHHKVLAKISFNAYKFVIEYSQVIKVHEGETLFSQGGQVDQIYFVLYGALMVTIQNQNRQRVGDVVRGGNVLGEEAFFCPDQAYKETAVAHTAEVGLIQVDATMLSGLGAENFKGKGQNMLAYQRDFRALFQVLREIYGTKEAWRTRALKMLAQQSQQQNSAAGAGGRNPPHGDGYSEYRHNIKNQNKGSKYKNN